MNGFELFLFGCLVAVYLAFAYENSQGPRSKYAVSFSKSKPRETKKETEEILGRLFDSDPDVQDTPEGVEPSEFKKMVEQQKSVRFATTEKKPRNVNFNYEEYEKAQEATLRMNENRLGLENKPRAVTITKPASRRR